MNTLAALLPALLCAALATFFRWFGFGHRGGGAAAVVLLVLVVIAIVVVIGLLSKKAG
jgi:hypothetical protein